MTLAELKAHYASHRQRIDVFPRGQRRERFVSLREESLDLPQIDRFQLRLKCGALFLGEMSPQDFAASLQATIKPSGK